MTDTTNNGFKREPENQKSFPMGDPPFNQGNNGSNENNGLDPKMIMSTIFRYKWIILFILLISGGGALYYSYQVTPTYKSDGTLLITPSDSSPEDELSNIISKATGYGSSSKLINELQILQSRKFSRQVARQLQEMNISPEVDTKEVYPILWTTQENGEVVEATEEAIAKTIRDNITFKQVEDESDVIEVSFNSSSPQEAAKVVNLAMDNYVENSTQQNRQAAHSTAEFLEGERENIEEKLATSEQELKQFMDSTGIVQVDEQASSIVTQRADMEDELQKVNLEIESVNKAISNYEKQLEKIKPGLSDQFSEALGPRIRNLQEQLAQYEGEKTLIIAKNPGVMERAQLPQRLKYLNEEIGRVKNDIEKLSEQLFTEDDEYMGMDSEDRAQMVADVQSKLVELRMQKNQLTSRRDALSEHKQEMDSNFNTLPKEMIKLAQLQRKVRMNEELYMNVSKQYADMAIWKQSTFGSGRVIDQAEENTIPVSPNKKLYLVLGLMLGGVFSAGFITLKEFTDNSVRSVDQLKTFYPNKFTLSAIPSFTKSSKSDRKQFSVGEGEIPDELIMLRDRSSIASEAVRRLKNNMIYQHGYTPPKTITVTSPEKGDGKSTIVANMGIAFAEEGYKTLLIDADFRRPKLQTYFGLSSNVGLTDYLDNGVAANELIQKTEYSSLKVITAGSNTDRPEIIGSSKAFKQFVDKMKDVFDVIILDTPPFGIISDSIALLKDTEATVVVARYRKTNKGMLYKTIEDLNKIQANVTDIVVNDFDHQKEINPYYGSGYYEALNENYHAYLK